MNHTLNLLEAKGKEGYIHHVQYEIIFELDGEKTIHFVDRIFDSPIPSDTKLPEILDHIESETSPMEMDSRKAHAESVVLEKIVKKEFVDTYYSASAE